MKSFQDILQTQGDEFLNRLMNDYVIVYEKLSASTLSFKRIGDELHFYKGSDKEEITSVNATLYAYFQKGIDYIKNASLIFYREFPEGWLFSLKYFVDNKTNIIEYDYTPQNNLVLSFIDNGSNIIEDPDILKRWAERLQTDYAQPLFQGFLTEFQKEKINDYVQGKYNEELPFSQYMISILNPAMNHSNYKNGFTGGVDSFIFKFYSPNSKKCVCAKIMDPYMASILKNKEDSFEKNKYGNETEIILANFIAFLQTVDIDKIEVSGGNDEERYLDLICKLFNMYIEKERSLFISSKKEDKKVDENYTVNFDNIKNQETAKLLKDNPNLVTAFQIIVGNFAQYKDPQTASTLSLLDKDLIGIFNNEVSKIKEASVEKKEKTKTFNELMADEKEKDDKTEKVLNYEEFLKKEGIATDSKPTSQEQPVPKKEEEKPVKATTNKEKEDEQETRKETKESETSKEHQEKQEPSEKENKGKEENKENDSDSQAVKKEDENKESKEQKTKENKEDGGQENNSGEENKEGVEKEQKESEAKDTEKENTEPAKKEETSEPKEQKEKEEPAKKPQPEQKEKEEPKKPAKKEQPKKEEEAAL